MYVRTFKSHAPRKCTTAIRETWHSRTGRRGTDARAKGWSGSGSLGAGCDRSANGAHTGATSRRVEGTGWASCHQMGWNVAFLGRCPLDLETARPVHTASPIHAGKEENCINVRIDGLTAGPAVGSGVTSDLTRCPAKRRGSNPGTLDWCSCRRLSGFSLPTARFGRGLESWSSVIQRPAQPRSVVHRCRTMLGCSRASGCLSSYLVRSCDDPKGSGEDERVPGSTTEISSHQHRTITDTEV